MNHLNLINNTQFLLLKLLVAANKVGKIGEAAIDSLRAINKQMQGLLTSGQPAQIAQVPALAIKMIFGLEKLKNSKDTQYQSIILPILDKLTILISQLRNGETSNAIQTNIDIKILLDQLFGGKAFNYLQKIFYL